MSSLSGMLSSVCDASPLLMCLKSCLPASAGRDVDKVFLCVSTFALGVLGVQMHGKRLLLCCAV